MEYRIVLYDESNLIDIMNTYLKTKGEFKKKYGIRYCPNDFRLEVEI